MRGVGSPTGSVDIVGRDPIGEDGESDAEVDPLPECSTPFMLHAPADASRPTFSGSSRASRALERRRSRRIARWFGRTRFGRSELDGFSAEVWSAGDARALAGRGTGGRTNAGFGSTRESTRRTRCARGSRTAPSPPRPGAASWAAPGVDRASAGTTGARRFDTFLEISRGGRWCWRLYYIVESVNYLSLLPVSKALYGSAVIFTRYPPLGEKLFLKV